MTNIAQHLAANFKREFGTDMEEQAKPLSMAELQTARDIERGHNDRINGKPQQEAQSAAYNEGYKAKESGLWAQ